MAVCPPVIDYGAGVQMQAAAELDLLPDGSTVEALLADYAVMRDQARACESGQSHKSRHGDPARDATSLLRRRPASEHIMNMIHDR